SMSKELGWFFFFQAEDGIRDFHVTGVQTCALPISSQRLEAGQAGVERLTGGGGAEVIRFELAGRDEDVEVLGKHPVTHIVQLDRSEERRGGKESRAIWATKHEKKKPTEQTHYPKYL